MWDIMGGKLLFTRIQRRGTAVQKELLRQLIGNKLDEWAGRPGSFIAPHILDVMLSELSLILQYGPSTSRIRFLPRFLAHGIACAIPDPSPRSGAAEAEAEYFMGENGIENFQEFYKFS